MPNDFQQLLQTWNASDSLYELMPLLIVATLLCVAAAVIAYKMVSLFFKTGDSSLLPSGPAGWRGMVYRWLFPDAARNHQQLVDEIERLRALLSNADGVKATEMEHHLRDQRRLVDQQREIEILQGQVMEKRVDLDAETDKLMALNQHTRHLEKQLEEIMHELERIYRNASERPNPITAATPVPETVTLGEPLISALPINPHDPQAEKLKEILIAYQRRVAERNRNAG